MIAGKRKPTPLDILVEQGADLVVQLEELDGNRKLAYPAFLREALEIADCSEKRIAEVKRVVFERPGTEYLQSFLRRYSKALSGPNYPRPTEDPSRLIKVHGSPDLVEQASQHRIILGELQALAVVITRERYGDEVFGNVENRAEHEKKTLEARERLATIHEEMRNSCTSVDLEFDVSYPAVTPSEKGRGLCRVSFRKAPDISPAMPDWPQQLVQDAVNRPNRKGKRARERLADAKAA